VVLLLKELFRPKSKIIGHNKKINISDAAIFWASFYHLMFKKNKNRMMYDDIKPTLKKLAAIHNIPVTYFNASKSSKKGYSRVLI
jgi:hypothetical protein